jgi:hypothetical protein
MEGRRAFTPGIDKALYRIRVQEIGLETFNRAKDYKQAFYE